MERKLERIELALHGNGSFEGIVSRVHGLEDDMKRVYLDTQKIEAQIDSVRNEIKRLAIGLAILMTSLQYGGDVFNIVRALAF